MSFRDSGKVSDRFVGDRSNDGGFIDASPWTDKDEATGISNRRC